MHDFPIYRNLTSFKPCFKRRGLSNGEKENERNRKRETETYEGEREGGCSRWWALWVLKGFYFFNSLLGLQGDLWLRPLLPAHLPLSFLYVSISFICALILWSVVAEVYPGQKKRQSCILATTYKLIYVLIIYEYINIYVNKPQIDFPDAREGRKKDIKQIKSIKSSWKQKTWGIGFIVTHWRKKKETENFCYALHHLQWTFQCGRGTWLFWSQKSHSAMVA